MDNNFGLKELYNVSIKLNHDTTFNNRQFYAGETIGYFDRIQLSNFDEIKKITTARGGFDNSPLIIWQTTQQINVSFAQGIFSKSQFALMSNNKLIKQQDNEAILISKRETLDTSSTSTIQPSHRVEKNLFVYDMASGEKIQYEKIDELIYQLPIEYKNSSVLVDYQYEYGGKVEILEVSEELTNQYLLLEGYARVKDDISGATKTAIIRIPKLKLSSSLHLRLGQNATPILGQLEGFCIPDGPRGASKAMEIIFLDDDIDADF